MARRKVSDPSTDVARSSAYRQQRQRNIINDKSKTPAETVAAMNAETRRQKEAITRSHKNEARAKRTIIRQTKGSTKITPPK